MSETAPVTGVLTVTVVLTSRTCPENPVAGVVPFKCLCLTSGDQMLQREKQRGMVM